MSTSLAEPVPSAAIIDDVNTIGDHLHVVLDRDHRQPELVLDAQNEPRQIFAFAPAIANAVFHATGKGVSDLPIKMEKLL